MNIWITAIADFPEGRGGTPRIRNIATGLACRGHSVSVFLSHAAGYVSSGHNLSPRDEFQGVRFEFLNRSVDRPQSEIGVIAAKVIGDCKLCWRMLRVPSPDVLLVYNASIIETGMVIILAKLLGKKVVFDVCDERFDIHALGWAKSNFRSINAWQLSVSDRILFQLANGFFVVSSFLEKKIARLGNGQPVLRIPLIARIAEFQGRLEKGRDSSGIPSIAYVGSLIPDEGLEMLLEAMQILVRQSPSVKCVLVGGGNNPGYERQLREFVTKNGLSNHVEFAGHVAHEDLVALLARQSVLALPRPNTMISRAGFPGKLGEYLASKRPVVSTNFGDISFYFQHDVNAFIVDDFSPGAFARGLWEMISDKERALRIGRAGFQLGLERFDASSVSHSVESYFLSLAVKERRQ